MSIEYFGAILVLILFVVNGWLYAKYINNFINPVSLLSFFWFLIFFIPLLIYPQGNISFFSIVFILFCLISFTIPFYFIIGKDFCMVYKFSDFFICRIQWFVFTLVLVGLVFFFVHLGYNGVSFVGWLYDPKGVTAELVGKKYAAEIVTSFYSQFSILIMYPVSFFAGLILALRKNNTFFVSSAALALPVLFFLVFGDKGAVFLVVFLVFAGWLVGRGSLGYKNIIEIKHFIYLSAFALALSVLVVFAFISRAGGFEGDDLFSFIYMSIVSYSSGHIFAFGDWFSYYIGSDFIFPDYNETLKPIGYYTFKVFFDIFSFPELTPLGTYGEYYTDGFIMTNIYTVFRGLIFDFGIFGALVFFFSFGSVVALGFFLLQSSKFGFYIGISIWYMFFVFLYSSYMISTFIWLSTTFSVFLVFIFLLLLRVKVRI